MTRPELTHSYSALKMFENCPKRYNEQRILKLVKDEGGEASIYGERIHKHLEDKLMGVAELPPELSKYTALCEKLMATDTTFAMAEQELTLNNKLHPTGWWDEDAWLRSKIDVLLIKGSRAIVIDWKTGKRRVDFFQLELFAVQIMSHYPEVNAVTSTFIWLKSDETDSETYTREMLPQLWQNVMVRIKRIEDAKKANVWPAKPSGLCGWCPCKPTCAYAR
jgi:hypothetical protein